MMSLQPEVNDDLTIIKGIKDTRQQLLRDALGIRTFRELAVTSPERIFAAFRAQAQPISRATITQWIEQARILMLAPSERTDDDAPLAAGPHEWRALAQFGIIIQGRETLDGVLELRTNAYHQEADEDQHWAGVTLGDVMAWVNTRIDPAWRPSEVQPPAAAAIAPDVVAPVTTGVELPPVAAVAPQPVHVPAVAPVVPPAAMRGPHERLQHYLRKIGMEQSQTQAMPEASRQSSAPAKVEAKGKIGVMDERLRQLLQKYGWQ
jgi:hypothetical protein